MANSYYEKLKKEAEKQAQAKEKGKKQYQEVMETLNRENSRKSAGSSTDSVSTMLAPVRSDIGTAGTNLGAPLRSSAGEIAKSILAPVRSDIAPVSLTQQQKQQQGAVQAWASQTGAKVNPWMMANANANYAKDQLAKTEQEYDAFLQANQNSSTPPVNLPEALKLQEKAEALDSEAAYWENQRDLNEDQTVTQKNLEEISRWSAEEQAAMDAYVNAKIARDSSSNILRYFEQQKIVEKNGKMLEDKVGAERLKELAQSYERKLSAQATQQVKELGENHATGFLGKTVASAATVGTSLIGNVTAPMWYLSEMMEGTGQYKTLDPNNIGNLPNVYSGAVRGKVAGDLEQKGTLGKVGSIAYQGTMSAADSLARLAVAGETGSLALAGMGSFGQTVSDASAQGASPEQAIGLGVINAGLEVATEKVSLGNLLDQSATGYQGALKAVKDAFVQAGVEISEEEISFIGSTLAEAAILREKSSYNQQIGELVANGMSYENAKKQADRALIDEAVKTAAVSGFSGGMMSGATSVVNKVTGNVAQPAAKPEAVQNIAPVRDDIFPISTNNKKLSEENAAEKIVNTLTGEEIDSSTYAVLERLNRGDVVTPDEIANLKEVQEGRQKASEMTQEFIAEHPEFKNIHLEDVGTYLLNSDERNLLRSKIISDRMQEGSFSGIDNDGKDVYNGNVKKDKRLDIVIGLPASGKSTSIVNPLSQFYKSVVIDSDIIKGRLPEYNDGWGSMLVHEESSKMNIILLDESMKTGSNIVLPIVGSKMSSIEKYIIQAKDYGYDINIHLNEVPNGKAVGRMLNRYFSEGRFIEPSFALAYGDKPTEVYEQIKQRSDISGYSRWNNDVAKGKRPVQIEISDNSRLYGVYSGTWRASRGADAGRTEGKTASGETQENLIAHIKEASSKDGVFFDAKNAKQSSNTDRKVNRSEANPESSVGAAEVVSPAEIEQMFPAETPIQKVIEKLYSQRESLEKQLYAASEAGDFGENFKQLSQQWSEISTRIKELEGTDEERINSLEREEAPTEMDAPYPGESNQKTVDDPFKDRDIENVGNRKVKAYQYENPEVKPYFQDEAYGMLGDLHESTRGEKWYNDQLYYESGGEKGWGGTKRQTTDDIAELLDQWHYTYEEIENGLNAIIEDNGAENNAVSKRIEFMLNDRLMNGYTGVDGRTYPPNQDYINLLNEKQITEYSKEAFESFMASADQYAPMEDDIAPVAENATVQEKTQLTEDNATDLFPDDFPIREELQSAQETPDNVQTDGAESAAKSVSARKELHQSIIDRVKSKFSENGLDFDEVLKNAKNLSTFATVDNTPQRVMEKALGYKEGGVLADLTVNKVAQNESEGIKWLNSVTDRKNGLLKQLSDQYHIKPGSKESAAAQMYAEGFYVDEKNNIIQYGDAELAADFPDARVRNNIKGLAGDPRIRQFYDDTLKAINESRTRNAYPEIPRLDNYFLHFRAMDDTFSRLGLPFNPNDIRAKDLPTDLNGVTADLKPGQPYFSSSLHRTGKRTSFDLLGGLERYATSAKNQIYHIDDIQTLRALRNYVADTYGQAKGLEDLDSLSEEEAQDRIEKVYDSHLSTFAKFLNEEANVLAGKTALIDRGLEGIIGRRGITFLNTMNQQVGSNMVGYNVSSSLTNFLPAAQTFAKTNKFDFTKAFAQTVSNKIGSIFGRSDDFAENSPVIIRRKGADRFNRTPWQKISDPGYALMGAVDDISTELIARTKYNEFTRKGMDSQQAHFETDKWVSKLMGDRSLGQMPQLYNSKMLGLVTKFQLEVRNQLDSQFYDTIQETKASNENIQSALARNAKTAAKVTSTFVQLAVAQHLFGKAFESLAGYNPAFDIIDVLIKACGFNDDDESEDTALDNIEQGFFALLDDLPYISAFTGGGRIPISSALPITEFINGEDQYGNEKPRLETLGEAAPYYLMPGGYGQAKKTAQGLWMYLGEALGKHPIAGSYTDSGNLRFPVEDTLANRVKAGVFGQYASENARDYFDNGESPLNEKQTQEFKALDIPIQDYWKYRDEAKKISDRAESEDASDEDILKSKYLNSVNSELSELIKEKEEVLESPFFSDKLKQEQIDRIQEQFDELSRECYESYKDVSIDGDYASVGDRVYKRGEDGEWSKLSDEQLTKYEVTKAAGDAPYATDGTNHYRYYVKEGETEGTWYKLSEDELEKQKEVTSGLGITPQEYWSNKSEYDFAYKYPEKYTVAKATGGYDSFITYTGELWDIKADKDENGKSINGSRKTKVIDYINDLDIDYGEKLILFKNEYNADDTYNYEIIDYLNSRSDISYKEMETILKYLGFKVDSEGNITW